MVDPDVVDIVEDMYKVLTALVNEIEEMDKRVRVLEAVVYDEAD